MRVVSQQSGIHDAHADVLLECVVRKRYRDGANQLQHRIRVRGWRCHVVCPSWRSPETVSMSFALRLIRSTSGAIASATGSRRRKSFPFHPIALSIRQASSCGGGEQAGAELPAARVASWSFMVFLLGRRSLTGGVVPTFHPPHEISANRRHAAPELCSLLRRQSFNERNGIHRNALAYRLVSRHHIHPMILSRLAGGAPFFFANPDSSPRERYRRSSFTGVT